MPAVQRQAVAHRALHVMLKAKARGSIFNIADVTAFTIEQRSSSLPRST